MAKEAGEQQAGRRGVPLGLWLVALMAVEVAWLVGTLGVTVTDAPIRRADLLLLAIPEANPNRPDHSILVEAARHLGGFENLAQRVPIVLGAALITGAALGLGHLTIRLLGLRQNLNPWERTCLAFVLGTLGLGLATLGLGRLGWLAPGPIRLGLALLIGLEGVWTLVSRRGVPSPLAARTPARRWWVPLAAFGLVAGPFLALMALGAMTPTVDFDAWEYHLQGPKEFYQAGRIAFLPHNVYTSMPLEVEMVHLLGMEVLDDWWRGALVGQLVVMLHAPAAAGLAALTAQRLGSARAAWFTGVVYLTTPWVYTMAVTPYVEGPLCSFHAAMTWAALRAWTTLGADDRARRLAVRLWGLIGLLAGGALACKYPALVSAVIPFGLLAGIEAIRRRSGRVALAFALGLTVAVGPWLARNLADTGNPVYPLAHRVFGGRFWTEEQEARWSAAHGRKPVTVAALLDSLRDVSGRSTGQSALYIALAPLVLWRAGSRRRNLVLVGYVIYLFSTWWLLTHRIDRFWLPLLPASAILAGLGADWTGARIWSAPRATILAVAIATNLVVLASGLAGPTDWTTDLDLSRWKRTSSPIQGTALARLDDQLPPGARVLMIGQAGVFPIEHPTVTNTVFNPETFETLARDRTPAQIGRELARRGITHIYVDWAEIERYRSPGNYGFSPFVTADKFEALVSSGILEPGRRLDPRHVLYPVRSPSQSPGP